MGDPHPYTFEQFVKSHKSQLEAALLPERHWQPLFEKLVKDTFDAGERFQIVEDEGKLAVFATEDLNPEDTNNVFLIDHAWTFRPSDARRQLENVPGLLERMNALFESQECSSSGDADGQPEESDDDEVVFEEEKKIRVCDSADAIQVDGSIPRQQSVDANLCLSANDDLQVDRVVKRIWRHAQTYTVRYKQDVDEDGMPVWYVMDEFGSRIGHSSAPNCRVFPLLFAPQNMAFSVLYLTNSIAEDGELTRDFADTVVAKTHPNWKQLLMYPWTGNALIDEPLPLREKPTETFFLSGRAKDELPTAEEQSQCVPRCKTDGSKLSIYADSAQLLNHLNKVDFHLVDDWQDADVLWLIKHFHNYRELCLENKKALVNQFPFESCLTVKDLLAATLQPSPGEEWPSWYQECFNLNTELPHFVSRFLERAKKGLDNTWIVKPWNLARGLDMHVSNDLAHIIRLIEAGPKIACKYIENPVLFRRPDSGCMVKFDLRFIVFVESFRPVKAFVYNNFWIRFAINQFTLTRLDDLETHFTVFNYGDKSKILQMVCDDFVQQLEATHPNLKWADVQVKINKAIRELLEHVSREDPPCGVATNAQSRAMYGVDVMLQWNDKEKRDVGVTILECNFMPDCERACVYYNDFADTVFETLFCGRSDPERVTEI